MKKVKNLKSIVEKILTEHGYDVCYQSHFTQDELKKYRASEPNMQENLYFTVLNKNKYVVGRLTGVGKNDPIDKSSFEKLLNYFAIYDIPENKIILEKLSKYE